MKKSRIVVLALLAALIVLAAAPAVYAQEPATITVNGRGAVIVQPDVATVFFGVSTQHANPRVALTQNNTQVQALINTLRNAGVAADDIYTSGFGLHPTFNWDRGVQEITGYMVSNRITVTIRNLDRVGEVLTAAIEAGATDVGGVSFSYSGQADAYSRALAVAVDDARAKATALARAAGLTLVSIQNITETGHAVVPRFEGRMEMEADVAAAPAAGPVPVETGDLTVSAGVQITWIVR